MSDSLAAPMHYDPMSENEREVPLPSEPLVTLAPNVVLQPPLTRRGRGPGLVLLLPNLPGPAPLTDATPTTEQIDPEPVQKWAEEGFAVLGVYASKGAAGEWSLGEAIKEGVAKLKTWEDLEDDEVVNDKVAMIVYDASVLGPDFYASTPPVKTIVVYAQQYEPVHESIPTLYALATAGELPALPKGSKAHAYERADHWFCFPGHSSYDYREGSIAHQRALAWIKKKMNGPWFDLEAIWEEHTSHEFFTRSVAKTMGTMVAQPYVNHVPTITGGVGRRDLSAFYRDHFIFSNPRDTLQTMVSRCVGIDRIAEEFTFSFTHDQPVDWLLPGVPPTYKHINVPMTAFVSLRGDRLYHEHISWDQATAYRQVGLLPTHVPFQNKDMAEPKTLRLPTSDGNDSAAMLMAVGAVKSNEMFGWGLSP